MSQNNQPTEQCTTVCTLQKLIGGKWKIIILYYLSQQTRRFGELQRLVGDNITQSTITKQLRELEADGFVHREVYPQVPPKVEYSLTELGRSFVPILDTMKSWGDNHLHAS